MTRDRFITFFFLILLIAICSQVLLIFSVFFHPIFWAAILAFAFYPVYRTLLGILGKRETLAAALTTLLILFVAGPLATLIVFNLSVQLLDLFQAVIAYVKEGKLYELIGHIRSYAAVKSLEGRILALEGVDRYLSEWVLKSAQTLGNLTLERAAAITKNILVFHLGLVLTFFLAFFFLRDGHQIYDFFYKVAPLEEREKKEIFGQITGVFAAVIRGQILTGLVQGTLAGTIFYFLSLPMPILIGALTFLSSLIPVTGASAVWLPFVIYLFVMKQYVKATILLILGVFVISLVDNFLKPALIGERTKLPYLLLFLGILGGIKVYGFMGIFLAPVLLSLFFALIKIYQERYMAE